FRMARNRSLALNLTPAGSCRQSRRNPSAGKKNAGLKTPAKRDPAAARKTADSGCRPSSGRQLRIFGLGGDENGDVGVGVFPECEENVVGGAGFGASGVGVGTLQRLRLKRV